MVTYEDVFTCGAVKRWSLARRSAWKGRATNPNEYLYRLPVPAERLATGAFTDAETAAFDRRLAEFQARGWPLSCWGLFSLALPHRVGYQCSQHYAKHYGAGAGKPAKPSAVAVAACQRELATDVAAAFAAPAAKRLAAAVDKCLAEVEEAQAALGAPPVARASGQQQRQRGKQSSMHSDCSSWESDSDFENDPHNSGRGGNAGLNAAMAAAAAAAQQQQQQQHERQDGALPRQAQQRTQRTQLLAAALPPPTQQQRQQQPGLAGAGKLQAAAAPQRTTASAVVAAVPAPMARPQGPQAAGQEQTRQHQQGHHQVMLRPTFAGQKRPQPPPVPSPAAAAIAKKPRPAPRAAPHTKTPRLQACADDSSSEDEFVAGSLRQAPITSRAAAVTAQQASKKSGRRGKPVASTAAAAAAAFAKEGFGERVEVIRLDTTEPSRWPGWQASAAGIRRVAPYRAALPPAAPAIQPGALVAQQPARGAVIRTQDLLSFDWSRLGGGFLGVLLQLGDSLPSSRPAALPAAADAAGAAPAAEQAVCAAAAGPQALSWQGLAACLRLGDGVLPCGLVFVWASKASVAPAVRLLGALGCKYVENLTWVQLGAGNRPLLRPGPLFNGSHATLLVGRRGEEKKAHLELRHQRTPDVIISPALRPGACPDAVYSMIETLLPDAGTAAKSGGQARLLELAFPPAGGLGPSGRPGWVTVVQTQGAGPA